MSKYPFFLRGILFAAVVVAILPLQSAAAPVQIRLAYNAASDWLAVFVAKDQGFFEKRNLDVTLTQVQAMSAIMGALTSKSLEVASVTSLTALQAYDAGIPLVLISGAHALPTPMNIGLLARTSSGIKGPADLVGRKVGVPGLGAILHVIANGWLIDHGVDFKKVTFVEVAFPQHPDMIKSGQIDAVLTADPFYSRIKSQDLGYSFGDIYERAPEGTLLTAYGVLKSWADNNTEAVKGFREALDEAIKFIASNPDSARQSLGKWTKLPEPVVASLPIPNLQSAVNVTQLEWLLQRGKQQGLLSSSGDIQPLIAK
jgi:NitT/TauT family transport system substrate-binding protein